LENSQRSSDPLAVLGSEDLREREIGEEEGREKGKMREGREKRGVRTFNRVDT